jgi:hypothetical protein
MFIYRVYKTTPLHHVVSHTNPVNPLRCRRYFLRTILILSFLRLRLLPDLRAGAHETLAAFSHD